MTAVNAYQEMGSAVDALEASMVLAEVAIEAGDSSRALAIVEEAQQATQGEGASLEASSQVVRGSALLALDRLDEAGAAITIGLAAARDQGLPFEEALLLRLRSQWVQRSGGASLDGSDPGAAAAADEAEADRLLSGLGATA